MRPDWTAELVDQLDLHWRGQLRPRLEGLTDREHHWEPVPGAWGVRPRASARTPMAVGGGDLVIDFAFPEPTPPPVTTIAWRIGHLVVGVLGARVAAHFGGPPVDYAGHHYPPTADKALAELDEAYAAWVDGVRGLDEQALAQPCGPTEGPFAERTVAALVLHIHREVIHHGAEIALLRDLYASWPGGGDGTPAGRVTATDPGRPAG